MRTLGDDDVAVRVLGIRRGPWGSSAIGDVVQTGARAATLDGKRVLVGPIDPCGECEVCRRGGAAVCPSAKRRSASADSATPLVAAARWVTPLGDGIELAAPAGAVVAGDVAIAYTLYARTNLAPRDPAVVVGANPNARFLVEVLRAKSITPTVIADPANAAWLDWLGARGATIAAVPASASDDEAHRIVAEATATLGAGARPWRLIATEPAAAARAAALAGPRATLTLFGGGALPDRLIAHEVTVISVAGAHPDLVVEVAALCARGDIDLGGGTTTRADDDAIRAHVET